MSQNKMKGEHKYGKGNSEKDANSLGYPRGIDIRCNDPGIGQFHIWGTLVGVMIVVIAINGLIIMMVPGYYTSMIQGVILLLAILLSSTGTRLLRK